MGKEGPSREHHPKEASARVDPFPGPGPPRPGRARAISALRARAPPAGSCAEPVVFSEQGFALLRSSGAARVRRTRSNHQLDRITLPAEHFSRTCVPCDSSVFHCGLAALANYRSLTDLHERARWLSAVCVWSEVRGQLVNSSLSLPSRSVVFFVPVLAMELGFSSCFIQVEERQFSLRNSCDLFRVGVCSYSHCHEAFSPLSYQLSLVECAAWTMIASLFLPIEYLVPGTIFREVSVAMPDLSEDT